MNEEIRRLINELIEALNRKQIITNKTTGMEKDSNERREHRN